MARTNWTARFLWVARLYAAAGVVVLLVFFVGEGIFGDDPWPPDFTAGEGFLFAFFPIGVGIGLLLGLWMPGLGGWIATHCLIGFYLAFLIDRSELPRGPWFITFAGGGPTLILADWFKRRHGD